MRSVWSRQGAGSTSVVSPSAYKAASIRQDFTWALAIGMWYSMALNLAGSMRMGHRPPGCKVRFAPILPSGSATLFIGRFDNELSPVRTLPKACPDNKPASSRMEVPELPR